MKQATDADLARIFNVPPVTEVPHYDRIRCIAFNCEYNNNGLCTETHEVQPVMLNGKCEFAEIDHSRCEECGEEKREIGWLQGGVFIPEFGCPTGH